MSVSAIQGQLLEITVVGCNKLIDTEWISRQDPYVCLEYASTKFRTRTCTDGGKNPTFQEKFVFTLIEGLREISVVVWNSNTLTYDDLIGSGKIQLQRVLCEGYDDTAWTLQDKRGRHAGEVRLIMHYANAKKPAKPSAPAYPSAPPASYPPTSYPLSTSYPPATSYPPTTSYPPATYPPTTSYPPSTYPPTTSYPPATYPPTTSYPAAPQYSTYPPTSSGYPPQQYPPTSSYPSYSAYPPPPADPHYYPPGSHPPSF